MNRKYGQINGKSERLQMRTIATALRSANPEASSTAKGALATAYLVLLLLLLLLLEFNAKQKKASRAHIPLATAVAKVQHFR